VLAAHNADGCTSKKLECARTKAVAGSTPTRSTAITCQPATAASAAPVRACTPAVARAKRGGGGTYIQAAADEDTRQPCTVAASTRHAKLLLATGTRRGHTLPQNKARAASRCARSATGAPSTQSPRPQHTEPPPPPRPPDGFKTVPPPRANDGSRAAQQRSRARGAACVCVARLTRHSSHDGAVGHDRAAHDHQDAVLDLVWCDV
jgi:hypothetical protein